MDVDQDLESLSQQLQIGDILELTIIDEEFAPGQKVEIPIACKQTTKYHIFLHFHPHSLSLFLVETEDELNDDWLELTIDHMDVIDTERAYIATYDEAMSWHNHLVTWKPMTSPSANG